MNRSLLVFLSVVVVITAARVSHADDAAAFMKPPAIIKTGKPLHATDNRAFQGIPSMAIAPGGRLWATWYAGITPAEDENNYVVLSTSDDGGATWTEVLIVDPDDGGPVRAYDPELWMAPDGKLRLVWAQAIGHEGTVAGVWFLTITNPNEAMPKYDSPQRITDGIMMCKPLVTSTGQWLLPASTWRKTDDSARVVASNDQGRTWKLLGGCNVPANVRNFDEHMLIERNNGNLWMLARTKYGIGESVSTDGGKTWPELTPATIQHTAARFFIRRLQSGNLMLVKHGPIDQRIGRSHLSAYVSKDDGRTWSGGLLLDERNRVSYPDGQQAADGTIRIIYDFDRTGERHVLMATFTEEDIAAGKIVSRVGRLRQLVSDASGGLEKKEMSRRLLSFVCLASCLVILGCDRQQQWPSRPITLICPWSAGGGTDRVSRQIAVQLEAELGVPVNVVNATGGGGVTGHTRGAMARPDGYTLLMATVELNMLHWRGLCPITPNSYRPLARLNQDSAAVFVRFDAQWQSIIDLENAFRESDRSIAVSGSAAGSIWHLALVGWLMNREVPVDSANWISINGSAPSLQELMAGGVDVVCCSIPEAAALLESGEVRCLGVMSDGRSPSAPHVPTFGEQNVDWSMGGWRGLAYPRKVPEHRALKMESAIMKVARSDEFAQFMDDAGFNISITDGAAFKEFLEQADEGFGEILTQSDMQQRQAAPLSPWFLPAGLAVFVGLLGVVGTMSHRGTVAPEQVKIPESAPSGKLLFGFVASIGMFIVCCQTVGYVIAAAALMATLLLMLRVRVSVAALIIIVSVPSLYQIFAGVLGVPLPWGWFGW